MSMKDYNELCKTVCKIMKPLGKQPDLQFSKDSFKQHDLNIVKDIFQQILNLCVNLKVVPECMKNEPRVQKVIDYYISRCDIEILNLVNDRLMNISERTGKEYQSYLFVMAED